jgi:hypothetical protein
LKYLHNRADYSRIHTAIGTMPMGILQKRPLWAISQFRPMPAMDGDDPEWPQCDKRMANWLGFKPSNKLFTILPRASRCLGWIGNETRISEPRRSDGWLIGLFSQLAVEPARLQKHRRQPVSHSAYTIQRWHILQGKICIEGIECSLPQTVQAIVRPKMWRSMKYAGCLEVILRREYPFTWGFRGSAYFRSHLCFCDFLGAVLEFLRVGSWRLCSLSIGAVGRFSLSDNEAIRPAHQR